MVNKGNLEDQGVDSKIIQKLTSDNPQERHEALSLVVNLEKMLNSDDRDSLEFGKLFRESQLIYENFNE